MSEKPKDTGIQNKNALSWMAEKIRSAAQIPRCILRDILFVLGLRGKETRESLAFHESGHTLVYIMIGLGVDLVKVHRMSHDTKSQIGKVLGIKKYRYSSAAHLERTSPMEYFKLWQEHPDRHAVGMIAGIAAETEPVPILEDLIAEGKSCKWNDVWIPSDYICERFKAINGFEPTKEQISELFLTLLAVVKETFRDEKIAKALEIIKEETLKRNLKGNVNEKILRKLEHTGYSQADLDAMRTKIFGINIDEAIAKSGKTTSS